MPVTYQQLANATLDQILSNPELAAALSKAYGADAGRMVEYWKSGYRSFSADKAYALQNLVPPSRGGLGQATEQYINWNGSPDARDKAPAEAVRKTALEEMKQYETFLKGIGLDPWDVPTYQDYAGKLGVTKTGVLSSGQTAEQTAIAQYVDIMKKSGGSYNPASSISADLEAKVAKAYDESLKSGGSGSSGSGTGSAGGAGTGTSGSPDITKPVTSAAFKSSAAYAALPQDLKDFVDMSYNLIEIGGEDEARQFSEAIKQAQAVADPYFKTQLALAKAEVMGSIAERNNDFETRSSIIKRTRDELLADVKSNSEFLTLEQQAEISREAKQYDEDLLSIADQAAEKGLTFATGARSRALAEERRGTQYADVVQSSNRTLNEKKRELGLKAQRGDTAAQEELASLAREQGFALQGIGRAAEQVLGSANLPAISGYTPTGGAIGKIEEEKKKAITSDIAGFMSLQKGFI